MTFTCDTICLHCYSGTFTTLTRQFLTWTASVTWNRLNKKCFATSCWAKHQIARLLQYCQCVAAIELMWTVYFKDKESDGVNDATQTIYVMISCCYRHIIINHQHILTSHNDYCNSELLIPELCGQNTDLISASIFFWHTSVDPLSSGLFWDWPTYMQWWKQYHSIEILLQIKVQKY